MEEANKFYNSINLGELGGEWTPEGYKFTKLNKFGSVAKAGVAVGDVLLSVQGEAVREGMSFPELIAPLVKVGVGGKVVYNVLRAGKAMDFTVKLTKKRTLNFDIEEVDADLERKIAPLALAA